MRILKSKSGMTMVSVIVAFTVIMIMFAAFSLTVQLSSSMIRRAEETKAETESFIGEYYTGATSTEDLGGVGLRLTTRSGDSVNLDSHILKDTSPDASRAFFSFASAE